MNELDLENVNEGDVVQYEEKYHAAAIARVLEIGREDARTAEDYEPEEEYEYQTVKLEVLDPIFGPFDEGKEVELGRTLDPGLQHYINWKLKEPGSMTEYYVGDEFESPGHMSDYVEELAEKYD